MESNLTDGILTVCKVLNKHSVQYMIVGGTAVALHGYYRRSLNMAGIITDKAEFDNFTSDFLSELKAQFQFRACFKRKEVVNLVETDIPFIGYDDLIEDKKANSRPKDIIDIEELKNTRQEKD